MRTLREKLVLSLGVLFGIYWIGVIGYMLIPPGMAALDACYMTTITLSTVGYREVQPPSTAQVWWTIFIITFGIAAVAVAFGLLTGLIVEGEIGRMIGSRKLESRIKTLAGHTIVCGFGRMGQVLVQDLVRRQVPLVVIERDPERCRPLGELKQPYIVGDATDESRLEEAAIGRAKSLVATLPSDADNMMVVAVKSEDGETALNPSPDHVLKANDIMVMIGRSGSADVLARTAMVQDTLPDD